MRDDAPSRRGALGDFAIFAGTSPHRGLPPKKRLQRVPILPPGYGNAEDSLKTVVSQGVVESCLDMKCATPDRENQKVTVATTVSA